MTETIDIIIAAAHRAGDYLRRNAFSEDSPEWKKANDPVTVHDRAAERIIREYLTKHAPGNIVGEEEAPLEWGSTRTYYIDPIDGTKEWVLRGFQCSTSIGVEENGELVGGVVYDFMRNITYAGYRGDTFVEHDGNRIPLHRPHQLTKRRIEVTKNPTLRDRLPRDRYSTSEKGGSIALSLAELAAGNYDGIVSSDIGKGNTWDVAAGAYLCHAAGMLLWDAYGVPFDHKDASKGIIGLRPAVAPEIISYLRESQPNFAVRYAM